MGNELTIISDQNLRSRVGEGGHCSVDGRVRVDSTVVIIVQCTVFV